MKTKWLLIILIFAFISLSGDVFNGNISDFFSYLEISEYDLNGNYFSMPEHYDNLFNKQKVKKVVIIETIANKDEIIKTLVFNKGFLSVDYTVTDSTSSTKYEYDSRGRLIKSGFFTFEYSQENNERAIERKRFFQGNYQQTEKIKKTQSGYQIVIERSNDSISSLDFIFENNLLKEVNSLLVRFNSLLWYKFNYENGYLKEIKSNGMGGWTQIITNRENGNIITMDYINDRDSNENKSYKFYNYDNYGNWNLLEEYQNNRLIRKIYRNIEYND